MKFLIPLMSFKFLRLMIMISGLLLYSSLAQADWREELGTLRIGIITQNDTQTAIARAEPFRLAIQEKLGLSVEIIGVSNLPTLIRLIGDGKVEYAIYTASSYAATWNYCECVEPLIVAKSSNGSSSISSVIITKSTSNISSIQDLAGKKILALFPQSIGGYAFAAFELREQSFDLSKNGTELLFENSGEQAIQKFINGASDALIGWSSEDLSASHSMGTMKALVAASGSTSDHYKIIWNSSAIPNRVPAVRKSLDSEAKSTLQELLLKLFEDDPVAYDAIEAHYGGGFEKINHAAFLPLTHFAKSPLLK